MNQLTLPYAHTDDPQTSFVAGQKMVESGRFHYSVEQVRQAIKRYCKEKGETDFTAKEVAKYISTKDDHPYYELYITIQKRKSVLRGFIEDTNMVRKDCAVWKLL